ncbi:ATP-binding cassette domain-containing protein, partial [Enterocloster asparagiformis]
MAVKSEHSPRLGVDITKKLKGFELEIAFEAGVGCLGILGPSGCGKSMTLKSIAGIETPGAGRIALQYASGEAACGRVLYDSRLKVNLRPQERRVGYLFQSYALFPNMTVEENIMTGLSGKYFRGGNKTPAGRREVAESMMKRFCLEGLGKRYPCQLSGGQQQRVALARILAYEP